MAISRRCSPTGTPVGNPPLRDASVATTRVPDDQSSCLRGRRDLHARPCFHSSNCNGQRAVHKAGDRRGRLRPQTRRGRPDRATTPGRQPDNGRFRRRRSFGRRRPGAARPIDGRAAGDPRRHWSGTAVPVDRRQAAGRNAGGGAGVRPEQSGGLRGRSRSARGRARPLPAQFQLPPPARIARAGAPRHGRPTRHQPKACRS